MGPSFLPKKNILPLDGYTVVDLTHQVAGPFCTMLLADLGALVIKIERPEGGDGARNWPTFGPSIFLALNRNKKSLALDLTRESGKKVFQKLLKRADVVVENLAPGVAGKLGASYDDVKSVNGDIVYCSVSGYGKSNPYSELPAWDPVIQALSGLMSVTGEKNGAPVRIGAAVVDMGAGLFAALGILSTLLARKNSKSKSQGGGTFLDISLLDSASVWMTFWVVYFSLFQRNPERMGSSWPAFSPYQVFRTKDDGYVFIGASNEDYWKKTCRALSVEHLLDEDKFSTNQLRTQNSDELAKLLEEATSKMKRNRIVSILRKYKVPCSPVDSVSDLVQNVALEGRNMIKRLPWNDSTFLTIANPLLFSKIGVSESSPPPKLGQDSTEILKWLGFSNAKIGEFLSTSFA